MERGLRRKGQRTCVLSLGHMVNNHMTVVLQVSAQKRIRWSAI